jgi:hypothetical protein
MTPILRRAVQSMLLVLIVPALVGEEVSRLENTSRRDVANGRSFG